MSITSPLLTELKGHTQNLLTCSQPIKDNDIFSFCECLEKILNNGLNLQRNVFGLIKNQDETCWNWLEQTANEKLGAPFSLQQAIDSVKKYRKVTTYRGRIRLLIRNMLQKRCVHIPVQILINNNWFQLNYQANSVLGDEILCQILLSILMLCSRLEFQLDLNNCRFLDETWMLPECHSLQLVPCTELGLTVAFVYGMAVVVSVSPFSVASDNANIKMGDVLDELNGYCITESLQGSLMNIMRKCYGQPITVYIIKAIASGGVLFGPLCPVLKKAGLDPEYIIIQYSNYCSEDTSSAQTFNCGLVRQTKDAVTTYIGSMVMGDQRNDFKSMDTAIEEYLNCRGDDLPPRVVFEFHNLGLSVIREGSSDVLLKHYFMEISLCSIHRHGHLVYIARLNPC